MSTPDWMLGVDDTPPWLLKPALPLRHSSRKREDVDSSTELRVRAAETGPVMFGTFVPFDSWTEINNKSEGHFFERFVEGSLAKTIRDDRPRIKVLFQHGLDLLVGQKVLGRLRRERHRWSLRDGGNGRGDRGNALVRRLRRNW